MSIKSKAIAEVFLIYIQMGRIEELQETFVLTVVAYAMSPQQIDKGDQNRWDDHYEETKKPKWPFWKCSEIQLGNQWSLLRIGDAFIYHNLS